MTVRMDKAIVRLVDAKDGKEMTVEAEEIQTVVVKSAQAFKKAKKEFSKELTMDE